MTNRMQLRASFQGNNKQRKKRRIPDRFLRQARDQRKWPNWGQAGKREWKLRRRNSYNRRKSKKFFVTLLTQTA